MHDNARPHTAGVSMDCLGEKGIDAIDWPACSPDLNPTEHCWDMVDRRVRGREHPPRTVWEGGGGGGKRGYNIKFLKQIDQNIFS